MERNKVQIIKLSTEQTELLVRLDERLINVEKTVIAIQDSIKTLDLRYVSQEEFKPIKGLVYGLVGLILSGLVAAVLKLLIL